MDTKETITFMVCFALVLITLFGCVTFYNYNQTQSLKSNIESAIVKGIDPLSVRCAYSGTTDNVCIAYAARK